MSAFSVPRPGGFISFCMLGLMSLGPLEARGQLPAERRIELDISTQTFTARFDLALKESSEIKVPIFPDDRGSIELKVGSASSSRTFRRGEESISFNRAEVPGFGSGILTLVLVPVSPTLVSKNVSCDGELPPIIVLRPLD